MIAPTNDPYPRDMVDKILADIDYFLILFNYISIKRNDPLLKPKFRKNGDYTMLCPLHHEKTPSLRINAKINKFKCFGCGHSGNFLTLLRKYHERCTRPISFKTAITFALELKPVPAGYAMISEKQLKLF
jgi:hypothetical protein